MNHGIDTAVGEAVYSPAVSAEEEDLAAAGSEEAASVEVAVDLATGEPREVGERGARKFLFIDNT